MILLDTNVISELWKIEPNSNVLNWIDSQVIETLYLSAVTVAELRYGLACMSGGKRRSLFQTQLEKQVLPAFLGRVLTFGLEASQAYADLMAKARSSGKAIGMEDGYIAATALAGSFAVATRDIAPFEAAGLTVINPWKVV